MTFFWKAIAMLRGWRAAYDYDMDLLVVWHDQMNVHYTGKRAWRSAALHKR